MDQLRLLGISAAIFNSDRIFRYGLIRQWDPRLPWWAFCGLNPSQANEYDNDPTIRRAIGFARDGGAGGLIMVNLYPLIATDPRVLFRLLQTNPKAVSDSENALAITLAARGCARFICAWGAAVERDSTAMAYASAITSYLRTLNVQPYVLRLTKHGQPEHPLRLPRTCTAFPL